MSGEGLLRAGRVRLDRRSEKFLVDANVLSEPTRPQPDGRVVEWLRANERVLSIDPIILGEIRYGILLLPEGRQRDRLATWFDAGVARLHCLPREAGTGLRWADLVAHLRSRGRTMPINDSMVAATALVHGLAVVTRNRADFESAGVETFDPFAA